MSEAKGGSKYESLFASFSSEKEDFPSRASSDQMESPVG
jgi:hypothetical protein